MCETCGCNDSASSHSHEHSHDGAHAHAHSHSHAPRSIELQQNAFALNQRFADENRGWLRAKGIRAFNVLSAPGSGKTALLEKILTYANQEAAPPLPTAAIVGDLQTDNDARRLRAAGAEAIQLNTGAACHLDAHSVGHALERLQTPNLRYVFIENVGNLVCPASFDLGEDARLVLLSVTEGEDKPLKYPVIFQRANIVVITKIDLAETVRFARETALENIRRTAPKAAVFEVSVHRRETLCPLLDALFLNLPDETKMC